MNFQLLTQVSVWWIFVCLLLGFLYAWILYRNFQQQDNRNPWFRRILFLLRFSAVSILSFLLLSPMIRTLFRETEKPILLFAQDASSSITLNSDSLFYRNEYPENVNALLEKLKDKYDVSVLSWADQVREGLGNSYTDKQTDFSRLYEEMEIRLGNRNVGAVVIASDGLYNKGSNPVYLKSLKVPVYTLALGDTTLRKDLLLADLNYNRVVYLGNAFPLEINIEARRCNASQATLRVFEDSTLLFSRNFQISGNRFSQLIPVILDAKSAGMKRFRIVLNTLEGEVTYANNSRDIYIEVKESRQKILLLANAPHPDLAALKHSIESNSNYSMKTTMIRDFSGSLKEYNLVILHNLPTKVSDLNTIYSQLVSENIPVWFILGAQTAATRFNELKSLINISTSLEKINAVNAAVNPAFSLFTLSDETKSVLPQFPPLLSPFGKYTFNSDYYSLLTQQVGSVVTKDPLLVFSGSGSMRTGVLCGEGLWRWKLDDFVRHGNFNVFNELVNKTVQNLVVKETRSRFRLIARTNYAENEPVTFDAEVYNNSYELIHEPDVRITITNQNNKNFPYVFSKTDRSYHLNAGYLPVGDYRYKATVNAGDQVLNAQGSFTVSALHAEQSETVADHQLLYTLASNSGGRMFYPHSMDSLFTELSQRDDLKSVSYSHYKMQDLVSLKWVFFLILGLLSMEWFLRKRSGAY
jgi:hypothetical protein